MPSRLRVLLLTACCMVASISVSVAHAAILTQFQGGSLSSVETLNGAGVIPPDMGGSVGDGYVMQMINGEVSTYNTAGTAVGSPVSLNNFWSSQNLGGTSVSDPRVIFDPSVGRWFASAISTQNTDNSILVGVSINSNPTSGFNEFSIPSGSSNFADYPTLGVNGAAVTIGTNNFTSSTGSYQGGSVYSIPMPQLLAATPSVTGWTSFTDTNTTGNDWTPQGVTNATGAGTSTTVLSNTYNQNGLNISTVSGANASGASLTNTGSISTWLGSTPFDPTQPGGTSYLPGDNRLSAAYQVGNLIYFANSINNGTSDVIQWGVYNLITQAVTQGTITMPGLDLTYPSISANANGTFVLGFNGSGSSTNISDYSVVCSVSQDTCGTPSLLYTSSADNYNIAYDGSGNRWGDYSWTTVDPTNPNNFWLFQEYASSNSSWGTVITEIGTAPETVPEPPTLAYFVFGLGALGLFGWRRRQKAAAA